ncbi:TauD/TfdA family dioxygenase [Nonomuraea sp. NPDC048916]|uniref:TauD/TfdA dioxygenase family protein n=1 Tax=Nonomuraea sp. NPDC048916 TaxID=3154232 RepID=UPI0033E19A3D
MGSLLRCVQLPGVGGDTCWANTCLAYETLSPSLQRLCDELTAVHDITMSMRDVDEEGHRQGAPVRPGGGPGEVAADRAARASACTPRPDARRCSSTAARRRDRPGSPTARTRRCRPC